MSRLLQKKYDVSSEVSLPVIDWQAIGATAPALLPLTVDCSVTAASLGL